MIPVARPHDDYLQFVVDQLNVEYRHSKTLLQDFFADTIFWITSLDLSQTTSLIRHRYSLKTKGRKPHDPADLLRSVLLMTKLQKSVDDWVFTLRTIPVYAILSGFPPEKTPGVGSFYDFFHRLWLAPSPHHTLRNQRQLKKPRKKGKKNEKQESKNPLLTQKLVQRVLRSKSIHYAPKSHDLLQSMFQSFFVLPSAEKGLLGNTQQFSVIGDGTPVQTGARAFGKFLCKCRKKGNWKCGCKRQFSDPDARWGWDSHREKYYYGRTLYMFCASDSPYDLPIYPRLVSANRHDSASWICGYQELKHWYPQWKLGEAILDSAHDALPIYTMLEHDDVSAIIDLNLRRSNKLVYNDMEIDKNGVAICPIGRQMIHWGKMASTFRRKWRCPAKIGGWECPHPCSPSDYGRTFYTSTGENPRLFPRLRRDSKEWRERYKLRTGGERCIKRQKIDYGLENSKGRSSRHWNLRVYLIAMCQHADAWFAEASKVNTLPSLEHWLSSSKAA